MKFHRSLINFLALCGLLMATLVPSAAAMQADKRVLGRATATATASSEITDGESGCSVRMPSLNGALKFLPSELFRVRREFEQVQAITEGAHTYQFSASMFSDTASAINALAPALERITFFVEHEGQIEVHSIDLVMDPTYMTRACGSSQMSPSKAKRSKCRELASVLATRFTTG